MAATLAIIAALSREIAGLTGGAKPDKALAKEGVYLYRTPWAILAAAGMGSARVTLAFDAAVRGSGVMEVISVGLAGACLPSVLPGTAKEAGMVVNVSTGERYSTVLGGAGPILASTVSVADVQEKARLAATYQASMVDMEAATVGRLALARGLRFRAIKGISDAYDFELPSLAKFTGKRGQFRTVAFALYTTFRPQDWASVVRLGRDSSHAIAAMEALLKSDAERAIR